MSVETVLALAIFILAYFLIAVRKIRGRVIPSWVAACLGAVLMLGLGVVSFSDAWDFIDFSVLYLLVGMMLMTASLQYCGLFEIVVDALMARIKDRRQFLTGVMVISAVLSAVTLNDAVVLILAPIVFHCCRKLRAEPIPYMVGVFISSNIGCMATITGSPHNALVAAQSGLGFLQYCAYSVPLTVICLGLSIFLLHKMYGNSLAGEDDTIDDGDLSTQSVDRIRLVAVSVVAVAAVVLFAFSSYLGLQVYQIALAAGIISLLIVMTGKLSSAAFVVRQVDWTILLFFIGLFVITAGVVGSGLMDGIASVFGVGDGNTPSVAGMMCFTTVLSNLVSNVPAVMLIGQTLPADGTIIWVSLAVFASLAGNLTLIGGATNIIVSNSCEKHNVHLDFVKYLKIGIPITLITSVVATVYLMIIEAIV